MALHVGFRLCCCFIFILILSIHCLVIDSSSSCPSGAQTFVKRSTSPFAFVIQPVLSGFFFCSGSDFEASSCLFLGTTSSRWYFLTRSSMPVNDSRCSSCLVLLSFAFFSVRCFDHFHRFINSVLQRFPSLQPQLSRIPFIESLISFIITHEAAAFDPYAAVHDHPIMNIPILPRLSEEELAALELSDLPALCERFLQEAEQTESVKAKSSSQRGQRFSFSPSALPPLLT